MLKNTRLIKSLACLLILLGLCVQCAQKDHITLKGLNYLKHKIKLDVAEIVIEDLSATHDIRGDRIIPASIDEHIMHWAQQRFEPAGKSGVLTIHIKDAATFSEGLKNPEDIYVLLRQANDPPESFGAKATIAFSIENSPHYKTGNSDTTLEKKVNISNDQALPFRQALWSEFLENFMNAFDAQVQRNLSQYLPKIFNRNQQEGVS